MKTIIIEDEKASQEVLMNYLQKYCSDVEVVGTAFDINVGEKLIQKHQPDLVFLDVEMPFGNGFDLLERIENPQFEVIFVTAFSHYAIKALNMSACFYLLKPLSIEELISAVQKAKDRMEAKDSVNSAHVLKSNLKKGEPLKIVLPGMHGFKVVSSEQVLYCKANDNLTDFHLESGEKYTVCKTLKYFDEMLIESGFYRVHKSHLVNLAHVVGYEKGKGGRVLMDNKMTLEVSVRKKSDFLKVLKEKAV